MKISYISRENPGVLDFLNTLYLSQSARKSLKERKGKKAALKDREARSRRTNVNGALWRNQAIYHNASPSRQTRQQWKRGRYNLQGDHSGCAKTPVDIGLKVAF